MSNILEVKYTGEPRVWDSKHFSFGKPQVTLKAADISYVTHDPETYLAIMATSSGTIFHVHCKDEKEAERAAFLFSNRMLNT